MSWAKKSEHIDKRTGTHYVVLYEPESKAEHHVMILLNEQLDGDFDPKAHIAAELEALTARHDAMEAYAKKHNVRVRQPDGSMRPAR